jgi:PIN domain nuclease of toxin-antitoxin system
MNAVLADTHAALWYLLEPSRLSVDADRALTQADQPGSGIFVSAISVVEVIYLVEKGKVPSAALQGLVTTLNDPGEAMHLLPLDGKVTQAVAQVPRHLVPDLPDRIIAATALAHQLPLVTRDAKLRASTVPTIW